MSQKAPLNFVSIRPFILPTMYHVGYRWTDFHKILYSGLWLKFVKKMQVWVKLNKNIGQCK